MPFQLKRTSWNRRDSILFLESIEMYIAAGLTIASATRAVEKGTLPRHAPAVSRIRASIESGGLLSEAIAANIKPPAVVVGLVRHGESAGDLLSALAAARMILERGDELFKRCISALMYPMVVGALALIATIGLMEGVMPQIIPMLTSLHAKLPLLTRIVMAISKAFLLYGLYAGISILAFGALISLAYRKAPKFRLFCHGCVSKVPLVGGLVYSYWLSAFLWSLGTLVKSGAPVARACENAAGTVSFLPLQLRLVKDVPRVADGFPLSDVLKGKKMPAYVAPLLAAGEASGSLGASLIRCATAIDRDVEDLLKRLTSLIEPVMMAGMGCVVGGIAVSIMMPIYNISRVLTPS